MLTLLIALTIIFFFITLLVTAYDIVHDYVQLAIIIIFMVLLATTCYEYILEEPTQEQLDAITIKYTN